MDGGAGFSEIWETFLYLKGASSYATAASMALVVWEYREFCGFARLAVVFSPNHFDTDIELFQSR